MLIIRLIMLFFFCFKLEALELHQHTFHEDVSQQLSSIQSDIAELKKMLKQNFSWTLIAMITFLVCNIFELIFACIFFILWLHLLILIMTKGENNMQQYACEQCVIHGEQYACEKSVIYGEQYAYVIYVIWYANFLCFDNILIGRVSYSICLSMLYLWLVCHHQK